MPKLRAHNLTISLDGFLAGPRQSIDTPLGVGGENLHGWMFATAHWKRAAGDAGGTTGVDNEHARAFDDDFGATIMGRNMFGPVRGEWPDDSWRGWWGENPPYHNDTFVLTHHSRASVPMEGGTTFHFVDGADLRATLDRAFGAAGGRDVLLSGGASTVRQFLRAGLVDDLHLAIVPVLLGSGERIFDGWDDLPATYRVASLEQGESAVHAHLVKAE